MISRFICGFLNISLAILLASCGDGISDKVLVQLLDCNIGKTSITNNIVYVTIGDSCKEPFVRIRVAYGSNEAIESVSIGSSVSLKLGDKAFKIETFAEDSWREIENKNSWTPRDGAGVVLFKDKVYLLGGWNHITTTNEVWVTEDLFNWSRLPDAPWEPRHGAGWLVHNERIYVIGGDLISDVWHTEDGFNWIRATFNAPFGERYTPIVHSYKEYIYLYGGQYWGPVRWCYNRPDCFPVGLNDVWRSRDGVTWEKVTDAPWSGRGLIHGSLVFKDEVFIVGGGLKNATQRYSETYAEFPDIWSSKNGAQWVKRRDSLSFPSRTHFSVLATSDGCYVSDGSVGTQINLSNNLYFSPNCIDYSEIFVPEKLPIRHASSIFEFNGSIIIIGGPPLGNSGTAIWQYFPKIKK